MLPTNKNKTLKVKKDLDNGADKFLIGTREGLICNLDFPFKKKIPSNKPSTNNETENTDKDITDRDNSDRKKMMLEEYKSLRKYLAELRSCQIKFFWSSIAATGIVLGFGTKLEQNGTEEIFHNALYFSCLATILIVCPLWCIWFLKASSITRVAGYLRVLEDIISNNNDKYNYVGWENSYFIYRRSLLKSHEILRNSVSIPLRLFKFLYEPFRLLILTLPLISKFEKPYQYNILTWLSFFLIAVFCSLIVLWTQDFMISDIKKFFSIHENQLIIVPAIGLFFTILYTSGMLYALSLNNDRSMATRERLWRYLLDTRMFETDGRGRHYLIIEREEQTNGNCKEREEADKYIRYSNNKLAKENEKNKFNL